VLFWAVLAWARVKEWEWASVLVLGLVLAQVLALWAPEQGLALGWGWAPLDRSLQAIKLR